MVIKVCMEVLTGCVSQHQVPAMYACAKFITSPAVVSLLACPECEAISFELSANTVVECVASSLFGFKGTVFPVSMNGSHI